MSRANGPNNPANRGVGGHIKEGVKNIPKVYGALYDAKSPTGARVGVPGTVAGNVRTVVTGKSSPGLPAKPAAMRAKIAAVGAASVTPLGPVVAAGMGIAKSVKDKKTAVAAQKAAAAAAPKAPLTPEQKAAKAKADGLKKTLNSAFPGLNMR